METHDISKIIKAVTDLQEKNINDRIEELILKSFPKEDPYHSKEIDKVATALSKAQGEYRNVEYNRENPYFKSQYADLNAILKAVRAALVKNGLSFYQYTELGRNNGPTILHSRLMHSSGQWIETRSRIIPPKNDQQSYGSTLTYQKRYAAMALLGITASNDATDDDGEVAMVEAREIIAKGPSRKYNPKEQSHETITKEQLEELEYELGAAPDLAETVLEGLRIQSLADMPKSKFRVSLTRIREIKEARAGRREIKTK